MVNTFYPWTTLEERAKCCEPKPVLVTEHLSLHYGEKPAFLDVTLPLYRGCISALVGPSGCGKSSFLMSLNRLTDLIPNARISGRLCLDEQDLLVPGLDKRRLRRRVGMIFQKPSPFPVSIRKNILLPLAEHGMKNRELQEEILENALMDVGIWDEVKDRLDSSALSLSGGQQQRLCFARALVLKPEILLMDEPCSSLDPISSGVVEDLIGSLRGRYTILIVTHNLAQARRLADYTAVFWVQEGAGRLIEFGPTRELFELPQEKISKAYLGGVRG